ncbi:HK97 family phage major capsid protein [Cryobacterium sp. MP_3.1]|uniref:phage major capsid protein n=1 Tax=Cryobacterium sp. MP_3.1 TaxID=3071711 RepID=UPI002DFD75A7|nr:HK97 family phage major capsid protein [Cryobacterium sp. MP_3.1]
MDLLLIEAQSLISAAKSGIATDEQSARLTVVTGLIKAAQANAASVAEGEALIKSLSAAGPAVVATEAQAKTLGAHAVKSLDLAGFKATRTPRSATEFKAVGDPTLVGTDIVADVDREIVGNVRTIPSVEALFSAGNLGGNALKYRVELPVQGSVAAVAEGDAKAQVTYTYEERQEGISTIAGFTELSDDMLEDLDYVAAEINNNLVTDLNVETDRQLLDGDGAGPNVLGVLRRAGVLTLVSPTVAENLDSIKRASTLVSIASGRQASALVINPLDFDRLILSKDGNGAYLGAGPFVATVTQGIWSITAVVTPAITQGTVLLGAFATGTVLKKGGVRTKITDSHEGNFVKGISTIVAERRLGLKVNRPAAFIKLTLATAA